MSTLGFISFSDTILARHISMADLHICAVFVNDRVRCWGDNAYYQLGTEDDGIKGTGTGLESITSAVFVTFAPSINTIPIASVSVGA
jgi:hypothetical protein